MTRRLLQRISGPLCPCITFSSTAFSLSQRVSIEVKEADITLPTTHYLLLCTIPQLSGYGQAPFVDAAGEDVEGELNVGAHGRDEADDAYRAARR